MRRATAYKVFLLAIGELHYRILAKEIAHFFMQSYANKSPQWNVYWNLQKITLVTTSNWFFVIFSVEKFYKISDFERKSAIDLSHNSVLKKKLEWQTHFI